MLKKNMLIVVCNEVQQYENQLGIRHLDVLKEVCRNNNLKVDKEMS